MVEKVLIIDYLQAAREAVKYLIKQVDQSGYVQASPDYELYMPHWLRDSSFIAISLIRFYRASPEESLAKEALYAAKRINAFNVEVLEKFLPNMKKAITLDYSNPELLYSASSHVPARVGPDHNYFKKSLKLANVDDSNPNTNCFLIQHDSVPLVLLALYEEHKASGLEYNEQKFLRENAEAIARYLDRIAITQCSDIWEIEGEFMHAYDGAAIYKAMQILEEFDNAGIIGLSDEVRGIVRERKGPLLVLKWHMQDGIIYRRRRPFSAPDVAAGVDSSEVYMFERFGITQKEIGEGTESRTIEKIEKELFGDNVLPLRNLQDVYFTGGRWLPVGLEFAAYYARHGELEKAKRIVDYVLEKYFTCSQGCMPEQELVNVAHAESPEGKRDLERNGGKPIQRLNWSYAALIYAILAYEEAEQLKRMRKG